jgi:hypothetical protein
MNDLIVVLACLIAIVALAWDNRHQNHLWKNPTTPPHTDWMVNDAKDGGHSDR